jgi:hypothetical protein
MDNTLYLVQAELNDIVLFYALLRGLQGKLLVDYGPSGNKQLDLQVNLDAYLRGIYLLTLNSAGFNKVIKLVVQ